jgi:hypothetical protein
MPAWIPQYKIRRSSNILSFAVRQNWEALNLMGEACFLIKIHQRANAVFQMDNRRVSTITRTASSYSVDPDTGYLRYKLWGRDTHPNTEYPDIGVLTCTVSSSGTTTVWEKAVDKYTFIQDRKEIAFDIFQDNVDENYNAIEDAVYVVFNTPPMDVHNTSIFTFGTINPLVKFEGMEPIRNNEQNHMLTLFGYDQWLNPTIRIRRKVAPNRFLVAFPDRLNNFTFTEAGLVRQSANQYWTNPPPYSPALQEHDIVVRESTNQRFQIIDLTPIYIENIFCSQQMGLSELDPRSSLYSIPLILV